MSYLKCSNCGHIIDEDEAEVVETTYESYYGVASEFPNSTPMTYQVCPYCGEESTLDDFSSKDVDIESYIEMNEEVIDLKSTNLELRRLVWSCFDKGNSNNNLQQVLDAKTYEDYENTFTLDKSMLFSKKSFVLFKKMQKKRDEKRVADALKKQQ